MTTDLLITGKLQLQLIFKVLLLRVITNTGLTENQQSKGILHNGCEVLGQTLSEILLISPVLARLLTFEMQHSSKCFPVHINPGNFEISEILKVHIYQNNLRWLLLISIKIDQIFFYSYQQQSEYANINKKHGKKEPT